MKGRLLDAPGHTAALPWASVVQAPSDNVTWGPSCHFFPLLCTRPLGFEFRKAGCTSPLLERERRADGRKSSVSPFGLFAVRVK